VRFSPQLRALLARSAIFVVSASALWALLPVVARQRLGLDSSGYGLLLACLGIGAVGGALGCDGVTPGKAVGLGAHGRAEDPGGGPSVSRCGFAAGLIGDHHCAGLAGWRGTIMSSFNVAGADDCASLGLGACWARICGIAGRPGHRQLHLGLGGQSVRLVDRAPRGGLLLCLGIGATVVWRLEQPARRPQTIRRARPDRCLPDLRDPTVGRSGDRRVPRAA
jgi:hypothetical protein